MTFSTDKNLANTINSIQKIQPINLTFFFQKGGPPIYFEKKTHQLFRKRHFRDRLPLIVRCGHDNKKPPPIAKRTPESERGPFSDQETTFRTIQHGLDGSGWIIYFSDFYGFPLSS